MKEKRAEKGQQGEKKRKEIGKEKNYQRKEP